MKLGFRTPSIKKSFKARTTGALKRKARSYTRPFYGKKGTGIIKNPRRAAYNAVYHRTTFGVRDVVNAFENKSKDSSAKGTTSQQLSGLWSFLLYAFILFVIGVSVVNTYTVLGCFMLGCAFCFFVSYFVIRSKFK